MASPSPKVPTAWQLAFMAAITSCIPIAGPTFWSSSKKCKHLAVGGFGAPDLELEAPFCALDKTGIVKLGARLGVPFQKTWSCYEGGELHCGKCGTCVERIEAFADAGVDDSTVYAR